MPIAKSVPTALRVARNASSRKRARFSMLPPQASVRMFVTGDRKELSR